MYVRIEARCHYFKQIQTQAHSSQWIQQNVDPTSQTASVRIELGASVISENAPLLDQAGGHCQRQPKSK